MGIWRCDEQLMKAKSEQQLASEQAWQESERLWLVHRAGFTAARKIPEESNIISDPDIVKIHLQLEATGDTLYVDDDDIERANPPQFDHSEDLSELRYVNESSILHTLRQRYASNLIHTYAGGSMIIINPMAPLAIYSEKVMHLFRGCKSEDMPPHIYSLAQSTYRSMLASRRDHSILLLGRSGSGKTTNFKHILHYLVLTAGSVNKLLLMERSRVVHRPDGEPTFHIFYWLLAGVEGALRKELYLEHMSNEPNRFTTPLHKAMSLITPLFLKPSHSSIPPPEAS
uniref:Myosin motor domain-containing protein n=1 Tax=Timema tahoe TaxID=61484 RepID=A0A7R9I9T2_9NEOP|nr:unnamed protein product [Timema tahoe]